MADTENESDCSDCSELNDCSICLTKNVRLHSHNEKCGQLCKICWMKVASTSNFDVARCPYCRENVENWLTNDIDVIICKNSESATKEEKIKYAKSLSNGIYIESLVIYNARTKELETFFYFPNNIKIEKVEYLDNKLTIISNRHEIKKALLKRTERFRRLCKNSFIINEYFSTFTPEKIKLVTILLGECPKNMFECLCGCRFQKGYLDKHISDNPRHLKFIEFFVDERYDYFRKKFKYINIDKI